MVVCLASHAGRGDGACAGATNHDGKRVRSQCADANSLHSSPKRVLRPALQLLSRESEVHSAEVLLYTLPTLPPRAQGASKYVKRILDDGSRMYQDILEPSPTFLSPSLLPNMLPKSVHNRPQHCACISIVSHSNCVGCFVKVLVNKYHIKIMQS